MKNSIRIRTFRLNAIFIALTVLTVFIASCSKNEDDPILTGEAKVMVVNAASGSSAQDFYLDSAKINTEAVAYSQSTAYVTTPAGYNRRAEFRNSGTTTVNFTGNLDIFPNQSYTFFYTTKADGTGNSSAVFTDETTSSSTTKARVRFVNLASGLTAANLIIAEGSTIASNIAFGSGSQYSDVNPGTINLQTALAAGGTASLDLGSFTLQAGKIYTVYTSGSLTSTVTASLITHN